MPPKNPIRDTCFKVQISQEADDETVVAIGKHIAAFMKHAYRECGGKSLNLGEGGVSITRTPTARFLTLPLVGDNDKLLTELTQIYQLPIASKMLSNLIALLVSNNVDPLYLRQIFLNPDSNAFPFPYLHPELSSRGFHTALTFNRRKK